MAGNPNDRYSETLIIVDIRVYESSMSGDTPTVAPETRRRISSRASHPVQVTASSMPCSVTCRRRWSTASPVPMSTRRRRARTPS